MDLYMSKHLRYLFVVSSIIAYIPDATNLSTNDYKCSGTYD